MNIDMLAGKNVGLRSLEENDLSILKDWRNSENIRKTTREYRLLNMINQKDWFNYVKGINKPKNIPINIPIISLPNFVPTHLPK